MTAVWELFQGAGSELLTLLALADFADDHGRCFPSIATIAKKTRRSKSQAQRVVHSLIDSGVVQVEGNESGGAPGSTRRYRVIVDRMTGRMGATGGAGATGRMGAADGSHGCGETGRMGATQTTIEPSVTIKRGLPASPTPSKTARQKRDAVTLVAYLEACKLSGVKPVPPEHHVRTWADDLGITPEMLQLAWVQFKRRYTEEANFKGKRQKDWPGTFANAVKGRWGPVKIWFFGDEGRAAWTSDGLAFKQAEDARASREAEHA